MSLPSLLLDALFPDACLACLAPKESSWRHEVACDACLDSVSLPQRFSCSSCGKPSLGLIPACHPSDGTALVVGAAESRVLGTLTAGLLYEGITRAAPAIAELTAAAAVSCGLPLHRAAVVPLPESEYLSRTRGYAAHEHAARGLATLLGVPFETQLFTASPLGGATVLGINRVGDIAAAEHLVIAGVTLPTVSTRTRLDELARAACPHATVTFAAATP